VRTYPKGFAPDLRRLRPWPSLRDSLWRNPALVRLTYGELARLVQIHIGPPPQKVLYVGPGLGHTALELARAGHDVLGVEVDEESVTLASRAADQDPFREERGSLSYELAEFPRQFGSQRRYDVVLFSRVLHHLEDPAAAVATAAQLLGPAGRVVCVEFAHDRLGRGGARWMARSRVALRESGWWHAEVAETLAEEAARVARDWRKEHEGEGLNPLRAMLDPLQRRFRVLPLVWHAYLFWELAAEMRVPVEEEERVATRLRDEEAALIREGRLRGVLFSTRGTARKARHR
jgi:SAM-dependent methyltransferase